MPVDSAYSLQLFAHTTTRERCLESNKRGRHCSVPASFLGHPVTPQVNNQYVTTLCIIGQDAPHSIHLLYKNVCNMFANKAFTLYVSITEM